MLTHADVCSIMQVQSLLFQGFREKIRESIGDSGSLPAVSNDGLPEATAGADMPEGTAGLVRAVAAGNAAGSTAGNAAGAISKEPLCQQAADAC